MKIETLISIKGYTLAVYYAADGFFHACFISDRGMVFDIDDIFYCEQIAVKKSKAIIHRIA